MAPPWQGLAAAPLEILAEIAVVVESDKDLLSLMLVSKPLCELLIAAERWVWRRRLRRAYDQPSPQPAGPHKTQYIMRQLCRGRGLARYGAVNGYSGRLACLNFLTTLVKEAYSSGHEWSKNLEMLQESIRKHDFLKSLMIVPTQHQLLYRPLWLALLPMVMNEVNRASVLALDRSPPGSFRPMHEQARPRQHTAPMLTHYDAVLTQYIAYSQRSHERMENLVDLNAQTVNMEVLAHIANHFVLHIDWPGSGALHTEYSALPANEKAQYWQEQITSPRPKRELPWEQVLDWVRPLKIGLKWKGTFCYLDSQQYQALHDPDPSLQQDIWPTDSGRFNIEDLEIKIIPRRFRVQDMTDLELNGWSDQETFFTRLADRCQQEASRSSVPNLSGPFVEDRTEIDRHWATLWRQIYDHQLIAGEPSTEVITYPCDSRFAKFVLVRGSSWPTDQDHTEAAGWITQLEDQGTADNPMPGFHRIDLMTFSRDRDGRPIDTFGTLIEGVILPGSTVIIGRTKRTWDDGVSWYDVGPFIWWQTRPLSVTGGSDHSESAAGRAEDAMTS